MMNSRARIVIVEDHALTRAGLRTALGTDFDVIGEASDGPSGLDLIAREQPDVAVVDIGLPGIDGVELTRKTRISSPATRVVIVTMIDIEREVLAALAAGADAYVLKTSEPERIVAAAQVARDGGAYFDPQIAHLVLARFGATRDAQRSATSPLSLRETQIVRLISEGIGNFDIAEQLHIGLGTVKGHIREILEKLSASDRTQAAVEALRRGYI